ncbi:helicase associated domain-containing protein [Arthrobacter sp. GMC3]|uniref:helicase associated domain-containing protein n=1 Tax=Arthrobacter sp. GMC3 TaxID=2058894 RepID=UPI000CE546C2|nr:helicase associated domain-containing protein [Arthrobacter sp. GMC3]
MTQIADSNHEEWDRMYAAGFPVTRIAELTGSRTGVIQRHLKGRRTIDPDLAVQRAAAPRGPSKVWHRHLAEVRDFIATHGHYPTIHGLEDREVPLYRWLSEQRQAHLAQTLGWTKAREMGMLGDWITTDQERELDRRWREQFRKILEFVAEHDRLPRHPTATTEVEHVLGIWMATQHQKTHNREILPWRLDALNNALPGWRKTAEVPLGDEPSEQ